MLAVHALNPSTQEAEAGGSLSSRLAWFIEGVPGQPGLYREEGGRGGKERKKLVYQCLYLTVLLHLFDLLYFYMPHKNVNSIYNFLFTIVPLAQNNNALYNK